MLAMLVSKNAKNVFKRVSLVNLALPGNRANAKRAQKIV
jgi:hypothetical protein